MLVPECVVLNQVADATLVPPKRPAVPRSCPPSMVSVMQDCWLSDPEQRLTAEGLEARLSALSSTECEPLHNCGPGGQHAGVPYST